MCGFIGRNIRGFKLLKTRIVFYSTLVRSKVEYGSVAWNPFMLFIHKDWKVYKEHFPAILITLLKT